MIMRNKPKTNIMLKKALLLLITTAFAVIPVTAQDADEILERYFEQSGQENLSKVNTVTTIGKIDQMGMIMPFKTISKRPNKGYMEFEVEGMLMKMAFDGERGWMVMPMTGSDAPVDLTGPDLEQIKEIGEIDSPLWNWKQKGHTLEYAGSEEMEGTPVHVLKLTTDKGDIMNFYIDSKNSVMLKTSRSVMVNGQKVDAESIMSDYREIGGVIQPFKIVSNAGGTTTTITMEEIRFDDNIDDAFFSKPVPE